MGRKNKNKNNNSKKDEEEEEVETTTAQEEVKPEETHVDPTAEITEAAAPSEEITTATAEAEEAKKEEETPNATVAEDAEESAPAEEVAPAIAEVEKDEVTAEEASPVAEETKPTEEVEETLASTEDIAEEQAAEPAEPKSEEEAVGDAEAVAEEEDATAVVAETEHVENEEKEKEGADTTQEEEEETTDEKAATTSSAAAVNNTEAASTEDGEVEEAEESFDLVAAEKIIVAEVDDNTAAVEEPVFTEEESTTMEADAATTEAATTDVEKAMRQRIADLRKALFTARALRRQADVRVRSAADAADVEVATSAEKKEGSEAQFDQAELIATLKAKATETEQEAAKLTADITNATNQREKLMPHYVGALKALFMLDRYEQFLVELEADTNAWETEAANPQGDDVEAAVLKHIRSLVDKRKVELDRLESMKNRIKKTAAELRRGHQTEKTAKAPLISGAQTGISVSAIVNGRQSAVREDEMQASLQQDDVQELRGYNELVSKQVETLADALARLTKEKGNLSVKLTTTKAACRKEEVRLNDELKQKSLRHRTDTRAIEELQRTNAALISTVETFMHTLNNEYYGAGERPVLSNAASGKQRRVGNTDLNLAIEDKKGGQSPAPRRK